MPFTRHFGDDAPDPGGSPPPWNPGENNTQWQAEGGWPRHPSGQLMIIPGAASKTGAVPPTPQPSNFAKVGSEVVSRRAAPASGGPGSTSFSSAQTPVGFSQGVSQAEELRLPPARRPAGWRGLSAGGPPAGPTPISGLQVSTNSAAVPGGGSVLAIAAGDLAARGLPERPWPIHHHNQQLPRRTTRPHLGSKASSVQ